MLFSNIEKPFHYHYLNNSGDQCKKVKLLEMVLSDSIAYTTLRIFPKVIPRIYQPNKPSQNSTHFVLEQIPWSDGLFFFQNNRRLFDTLLIPYKSEQYNTDV